MAGGVIAVGLVKYKRDNVRVRACYTEGLMLDSGGIEVAESWRAVA